MLFLLGTLLSVNGGRALNVALCLDLNQLVSVILPVKFVLKLSVLFKVVKNC